METFEDFLQMAIDLDEALASGDPPDAQAGSDGIAMARRLMEWLAANEDEIRRAQVAVGLRELFGEEG
jgi:hypothetical protein